METKALNVEACCNKLVKAVKKVAWHKHAHVHFRFKNKKDELVVICSETGAIQIVVKEKNAPKGESKPWEESDFGKVNPEEALLKNQSKIENIKIDAGNFRMEWKTLPNFMQWLDEMQ